MRVEMMLEKDRDRFEKATKITQAEALADPRWVAFYDPTLTVNSGHYDDSGYGESLRDIVEDLRAMPADERPPYVYPCRLEPFRISAEQMVEGAIENACCDHHEDMPEQVKGEDDLLAAIRPIVDAFNAKQTSGTWDPVTTIAIVLDYSEPPADG